MATNNDIGGDIYRYNESLSRLDYELENNGGEFTPEVETMLTESYNKGELLASSLYGWTAEKKAFINLCKEEKRRISDMQSKAENSVSYVKDWLLGIFLRHDVTEVKDGIHKVSVMAGRESVDVNEDVIYETYRKRIDEFASSLPTWLKVSVEVSKTELSNAIKAGEVINGAAIVRNPSLKIQ